MDTQYNLLMKHIVRPLCSQYNLSIICRKQYSTFLVDIVIQNNKGFHVGTAIHLQKDFLEITVHAEGVKHTSRYTLDGYSESTLDKIMTNAFQLYQVLLTSIDTQVDLSKTDKRYKLRNDCIQEALDYVTNYKEVILYLNPKQLQLQFNENIQGVKHVFFYEQDQNLLLLINPFNTKQVEVLTERTYTNGLLKRWLL